MPPVNNEPTDPNTPVTPPVAPQPPVKPIAPPTAPDPAPEVPSGTNNIFGQAPMTPVQPVVAGKPGFKIDKKMAIIAGAVVVVALLTVGAFTFLKAPIAQIASNVGIGGINLQDYSNDKFKFSLKVPEGWETETRDTSYDTLGLATVTMAEPAGDLKDTSEANSYYAGLQISVNDSSKITYGQKDETTYFSDIKKTIQSAITADQETGDTAYSVESDGMTTVNGLKAYKVKMKVTNFDYKEGETGYRYLLAVFINESLSYKVELAAHSSETAVLAKADAILESFKSI